MWDILFVSMPFYLCSLGMQETYGKILRQRHAKRNGVEVPKDDRPASAKIKQLFVVTIARPVRMLLTEPIVAFLSLYVGFVFAVLNAFFAAFPYVFETTYGFNEGQAGLVFLGVGIGVMFGVITGLLCDRLIYQKKFAQALHAGKTRLEPEARLYAACIASIGVPVGLFWFAWTARKDVHWICPVLSTIPFAWGNVSIFVSRVLARWTIDASNQS